MDVLMGIVCRLIKQLEISFFGVECSDLRVNVIFFSHVVLGLHYF